MKMENSEASPNENGATEQEAPLREVTLICV